MEWQRDATGYRLPTEGEWEYACRAGTSTEYCFGDSPELLSEYALYWRNSTSRGTASAGRLKCNGWGLFDMHGNVFEWCWELFDPKGPEGSPRVSRGGGWYFNADFCRSAKRSEDPPTSRHNNVGFRVLRSSVEQASK